MASLSAHFNNDWDRRIKQIQPNNTTKIKTTYLSMQKYMMPLLNFKVPECIKYSNKKFISTFLGHS